MMAMKMKSRCFNAGFLEGDGEATKSDLRDEESKGCSCVLFQPLAGNLSNHKYVLHDQIVQRSRL